MNFKTGFLLATFGLFVPAGWGPAEWLPAGQAQAQTTQRLSPVLLLSDDGTEGRLLGAWNGRRWLPVSATAKLLKPGVIYSVQGLTSSARRAVGGKPVSLDETCPDAYSVPLTPALSAPRTQIATTTGIKARPRPVTVLPTRNPAYEQVVRAELQRRGLKNPVVQLRSVNRTDLDGDGRAEIIIEATHYAQSGAAQLDPVPDAQAGDYSLLLLRWVNNGQAQTTALDTKVVLGASTDPTVPRLGLRFRLEGVADLNGDGRMELITSESYYEGDSQFVYTWTPGTGPKKVLETGCGV
jgi:hypothetical protein